MSTYAKTATARQPSVLKSTRLRDAERPRTVLGLCQHRHTLFVFVFLGSRPIRNCGWNLTFMYRFYTAGGYPEKRTDAKQFLEAKFRTSE